MSLKNPVLKFLIWAFLLYISWFLIYHKALKKNGIVDDPLTIATANSAAWLFHSLEGYKTTTGPGEHAGKTIIYVDDKRILGVASYCNGLELLALFAGFILCFPGSWKNKLWFIPSGMILIFICNVIRLYLLCLNRIFYPQYMEFNHKYTFTIMVYSFIFLLWMIWVNRFSKKDNSDPDDSQIIRGSEFSTT